MPSRSAAGQNQSAVPSLIHGRSQAWWKVSRTPSMPGWLFQVSSIARACGCSTGMRPITAKRSGCFAAASSE